MPRRNRNGATTAETFTIWTSFTDLMSNAFMIITLLLLFFVAKSSTETSDDPISKPKNNKPTIISLPAEKYSFKSGSAVLPQNLQDDISQKGEDGVILRTIEESIAELEKSDKQVDVIEVIGHTDGQAVGSLKCDNQKGGNLDKKLESVSKGYQDIACVIGS
jgi:flagellar motor protein MotB